MLNEWKLVKRPQRKTALKCAAEFAENGKTFSLAGKKISSFAELAHSGVTKGTDDGYHRDVLDLSRLMRILLRLRAARERAVLAVLIVIA